MAAFDTDNTGISVNAAHEHGTRLGRRDSQPDLNVSTVHADERIFDGRHRRNLSITNEPRARFGG